MTNYFSSDLVSNTRVNFCAFYDASYQFCLMLFSFFIPYIFSSIVCGLFSTVFNSLACLLNSFIPVPKFKHTNNIEVSYCTSLNFWNLGMVFKASSLHLYLESWFRREGWATAIFIGSSYSWYSLVSTLLILCILFLKGGGNIFECQVLCVFPFFSLLICVYELVCF